MTAYSKATQLGAPPSTATLRGIVLGRNRERLVALGEALEVLRRAHFNEPESCEEGALCRALNGVAEHLDLALQQLDTAIAVNAGKESPDGEAEERKGPVREGPREGP